MNEMKSLTLNDKTYDGFVDPVARAMSFASAVVNSASGESITVSDSSDGKPRSLTIYGKTTQDGTPTPDAPVDLVSVGNSGSITVNVTGENDAQSVNVATLNGLPGIPVDSGGNYTDANGQQWICDEVDFARGVYVQRINRKEFTGSEEFALYSPGIIYYERFALTEYARDGGVYASLCTYLPYNPGELTGEVGQRFRKGANNQNRIYFAHSNFTTVDAFVSFVEQAYSSGTPLSVVYALNTPIETPLSEEELAAYSALHTYRNHTTVSNDASAHMELEYVMDAKKYIDSLMVGGIHPATVE